MKKPGSITLPNGDVYKPAVFKVETYDEQGRPENLTMIPEDGE